MDFLKSLTCEGVVLTVVVTGVSIVTGFVPVSSILGIGVILFATHTIFHVVKGE